MTVWFTSDLHLGHARLLELSAARGSAFASLGEHDARLVANWNETSQFRLRDEGLSLLHGHAHDAFRERRTPEGTWGINVGVDWWDYRPVSAERLSEHLEDLSGGRVAPITDDSDR